MTDHAQIANWKEKITYTYIRLFHACTAHPVDEKNGHTEKEEVQAL